MSLDPTNVSTKQHDLATVTGAETELPKDTGIVTITRSIISLDSALARPVYIAQYIDTGITPSGHIDVFKKWCSHSSVVPKLSNYAGIKCDFRIRIEYAPNPLMVGRRIWGVNRIPEPLDLNWYRHNLRIYRGPNGDYIYPRTLLVQRPIHGFTEPSGEGILEFVVKYAHNREFYYKYRAPHPDGIPTCPPFDLYHDVEVPIYKMDGSAVGNSTITYNIYASVENVELFMPTRTQSDRENPYRAASSVVASASKFANQFGVSTTPVDMARKMGDSVASYFGYSKPSVPSTPCYDARVVGELVSYNGTNAGLMLADDVNDNFAVGRDDLTCDIEADDTSIAYIGSVPGYTWMHSSNISPYLTVWNSTAIQGSTLCSLVAGPAPHVPSSTTWEVPTPGDYLALAFNWWRCDEVVFTIEVIANPFYRGTLYVEWEPTNNQEVYWEAGQYLEFAHGYLKTENVVFTGSTTFEFSVPWMDECQFLPVKENYDMDGYVVHSNLGKVRVAVGAPLRCGMVDTSKCHITVKKHYKNLRLYDYNPSLIRWYNIAPNYNVYNEPATVVQSDKVGAYCFGEELKTVNQIVKISTPQLWHLDYESGIIANNNLDLVMGVPLEPVQPTNYGYTATEERMTELVRYTHPLPYFCSMYLARSGTVKSTACLVGGTAPAQDACVWATKPVRLGTHEMGGYIRNSPADRSPYEVLLAREVFKGNGARLVSFETKPVINSYQSGGHFNIDERLNQPIGVKVTSALSKDTQGYSTPSFMRVDYAAGESFELRCFQGLSFGIQMLTETVLPPGRVQSDDHPGRGLGR